MPSPLQVYRAVKKPFHEWITQTRLFDGYFDGTFDDYELDLDSQIIALIVAGKQSYSESLLIPSYLRVEVLKTLRALRKNNDETDLF